MDSSSAFIKIPRKVQPSQCAMEIKEYTSTLEKSDLEINASISARNLLRHRAKSHDEGVIIYSSEKNAEILLKVSYEKLNYIKEFTEYEKTRLKNMKINNEQNSILKLKRIQKMTVSDFSTIGMERYSRLVKKEKYMHGRDLIDFKFEYSDLEINYEKMLGPYGEGWVKMFGPKLAKKKLNQEVKSKA
ncbi:hypothetical protein Glove_174g96 [Diversispora epigaea]|uniref:Uncharacterized protein n=1 Tax=Diversispora epigaea TaxID=1348612 RepID=A0A397IRW7_9GLOM|nr:hypothetical protein Glove_174g96 [Diversispora epigaea]